MKNIRTFIETIFKHYTSIVALFFLYIILVSNAAQPGIWNAGGGGYHLLFPEDSINFKRIQMQSEKINVQLYNGFAVVKGEYNMSNDTDDTISVKVGYPVNGIYEGNSYGKLNQVTFDGLYKLKTKQNGVLLPIIETPILESQENTTTFENDNWYVWENTFLPRSMTSIEVYFIVNTNNAQIREGYTKDSHNVFIYLLESGSVWKQPIVQGDFKIGFMEKLSLKDLHGISDLNWEYDNENTDERVFYASKHNFSPTPLDNIVINYSERIEGFDFNTVVDNSDDYFNAIHEFSTVSKPEKEMSELEVNDPYDTGTPTWAYFIILIGIVILIGLFFLFKWIIKTLKRT